MNCIIIQGQPRKVPNLEVEVNNWLASNPNVKIVGVAQSMSDARVLVTIFYE